MKDFWSFCRPYFTNICAWNDGKVIFIENNKVLRSDYETSEPYKELGTCKRGNNPSPPPGFLQKPPKYSNDKT